MVENTINFITNIIQNMLETEQTFIYIKSDLDFSYYSIDIIKNIIGNKLNMNVYKHTELRLMFQKNEKTIIIHRCENKISAIEILNENQDIIDSSILYKKSNNVGLLKISLNRINWSSKPIQLIISYT